MPFFPIAFYSFAPQILRGLYIIENSGPLLVLYILNIFFQLIRWLCITNNTVNIIHICQVFLLLHWVWVMSRKPFPVTRWTLFNLSFNQQSRLGHWLGIDYTAHCFVGHMQESGQLGEVHIQLFISYNNLMFTHPVSNCVWSTDDDSSTGPTAWL